MSGTSLEDLSSIEDATLPVFEEPRKHMVVLFNDDRTPMDFVVKALMEFFGHEAEKATEIMLQVHNTGQGVAGVYPREIAEALAVKTVSHARKRGHPLRCETKPELP